MVIFIKKCIIDTYYHSLIVRIISFENMTNNIRFNKCLKIVLFCFNQIIDYFETDLYDYKQYKFIEGPTLSGRKFNFHLFNRVKNETL